MTTLREAAQQALEALEAGPNVDPIFAGETEDALRAALAEPVQEPKPVAWMFEFPDKRIAPKFDSCPHGGNWVPLYTAPPQRKPLTEEEIDSIWDSEKAFADIYAIVRAIERAYGITP